MTIARRRITLIPKELSCRIPSNSKGVSQVCILVSIDSRGCLHMGATDELGLFAGRVALRIDAGARVLVAVHGFRSVPRFRTLCANRRTRTDTDHSRVHPRNAKTPPLPSFDGSVYSESESKLLALPLNSWIEPAFAARAGSAPLPFFPLPLPPLPLPLPLSPFSPFSRGCE